LNQPASFKHAKGNDSSGLRNIALLGSTGSIGVQALDVIRSNPDKFRVETLTANFQADRLIAQALEFRPNAVVIADESQYQKVKEALLPQQIKVFAGKKALASIVESGDTDLVLNALVGYSGLEPTLRAIAAGKPVALANKETLVVAGELVNRELNSRRVAMIPVDSEHSAIFQCLAGETHNPIECIYLTASGGPFRGRKKEELGRVTFREALKHPNWDMGAKITIDSSTLMNKGFEVIEAKWLFGLDPEQIRVIVHPQSILHSIVQFEDGSMKAQMGLPDMKLPIQYALAYPNRIPSAFPRFDFIKYPNLSFEEPDRLAFPCLDLAYEAMKMGGNAACRLNAANEIAVESFLKEEISYLQIPEMLEYCLLKGPHINQPAYEDYVRTDMESREMAINWKREQKLIKHI
jgi:1-deoxy-D-xylulose-5-phosphate reductoisomerase